MKTYAILLDLAIIFISAKLFGLLARKCKAPMVVGEILAGLIIGPCLLNIVKPSDFISQMAEIGVILIMFSAGLETNLQELKKSGFIAFLIACVGVFVPLVGGSLLYMTIYGFSSFGSDEFFKAVYTGCIMTATSVGITVEVLKELGYLKSRVGQTILSAAIIDDIIGIIVLTFVLGFKDPNSNTLLISGKIILFLILSVILGYIIYRIFKIYDEKHVHTRRIPIIAISLCFIMAYVAEEYFGIADITGAYIAGIILCSVRDADYIDRKVNINGYMPGKKVVILGSGDIGLIMARRMTLEGAKVLGVAELMPYSNGLARNIAQCLNDFDIPLYLSHTVKNVIGKDHVEKIVISKVDDKFNYIEENRYDPNLDPIYRSTKEYTCDKTIKKN